MNAIKITVNGEERLINLDCVEEVSSDNKNKSHCISYVSGNKVLLNEKEFEEFKAKLTIWHDYKLSSI